MGLLSSSTSITRYRVDGKIEAPILDTIAAGLKKNTVADIDENPSDRTSGWASFQDPFNTDFEGSSFVFGTYIVFALRVDKKSIPAKMVQKHFAIESAKRLAELGREFLTANEKRAIKDHVINELNRKIPSTPNVYDLVWMYESGEVWFYSNLKSANEELETLFIKSFGVSLVHSIPYTMAALDNSLSADQLDALNRLAPENRDN